MHFDWMLKINEYGFGQVVSVITFYSDDPSSNPAEFLQF